MSCSHSFAVCAYGKSPYLKECLDSLVQQEFADSKIYIATSTPSAWLDEVAKEYNLEVFVNDGEYVFSTIYYTEVYKLQAEAVGAQITLSEIM